VTGVARKFCANNPKVTVVGAYKSICVSGASKVLEDMGIDWKLYDPGIIDKLGTSDSPIYI